MPRSVPFRASVAALSSSTVSALAMAAVAAAGQQLAYSQQLLQSYWDLSTYPNTLGPS